MIEEQNEQPVAGGLDAKIAELKCELAYVRLQRDALLDMTWLDMPAEPSESTAEWRRLFAEGWVRRAAADDSAQPPLEDETRVRLQRTGYPTLTWCADRPTGPGRFWWQSSPLDDAIVVTVFLSPEGLSVRTERGQMMMFLFSRLWREQRWAGPLVEPQEPSHVESSGNKELCGGASPSASATAQPKP